MSSAVSCDVLFEHPPHAAFGQPVPKSRIYAAGKPSRKVRDQMVQWVERIVWKYKLAPETINLPASDSVPEIQVFELEMKQALDSDTLPEAVLRCIDRAVNFPIIFELTASNGSDDAQRQIQAAAAYKRPNEAEAGKWVLGDYYATGWCPADTPRKQLPVAVDMARLYEQMLRQMIPVQARDNEPLKALVERHGRIQVKQREYQRLESKMYREKQFNRKVELNCKLRALQAELAALTE